MPLFHRTERRVRGDVGEDAAAAYLKRAGYRILGRNLTFGPHEIDLVVCDREYTVICEVKTRTPSSYGRPMEAVNAEKRRCLIAAAAQYRAAHPDGRRLRFDVVEVYLGEDGRRVLDVRHIPAAFTA